MSDTPKLIKKGGKFWQAVSIVDENGDPVVGSEVEIIFDGLPLSEANPLPTERPLAQVTPTITDVTTSGSVPSGKYTVTFITSSDFAGTILGSTILPDSTLSFSTDYNAVLSEIAYTVTTGSIKILIIQ